MLGTAAHVLSMLTKCGGRINIRDDDVPTKRLLFRKITKGFMKMMAYWQKLKYKFKLWKHNWRP